MDAITAPGSSPVPAAEDPVSSRHTVLLLGGTGRTGSRVLEQLLRRGVHVRVVVRSAGRLPAGVVGDPHLTVTVADLTALSNEELARLVEGCDAVISCLGHATNLRGIFGPPRDLVTRYALHEGLVNSLARPGETNMASVAHFMCELATDPQAWAAWQGELPVVVNAPPA